MIVHRAWSSVRIMVIASPFGVQVGRTIADWSFLAVLLVVGRLRQRVLVRDDVRSLIGAVAFAVDWFAVIFGIVASVLPRSVIPTRKLRDGHDDAGIARRRLVALGTRHRPGRRPGARKTPP